MNIRKKIYDYQVRQSAPRQATFPRYDDISSVLIIFESDYLERNTLVKSLSSQLQNEGKTVATWGYVEKKDIQSLILPIGRVMGTRDINILHRPKSHVLSDLGQQHYDLLIDLTQHECLPLHYLSLYADAEFKTGKKREDKVLDLMIDMPAEETPQALFEQIIRYLKMINNTPSNKKQNA